MYSKCASTTLGKKKQTQSDWERDGEKLHVVSTVGWYSHFKSQGQLKAGDEEPPRMLNMKKETAFCFIFKELNGLCDWEHSVAREKAREKAKTVCLDMRRDERQSGQSLNVWRPGMERQVWFPHQVYCSSLNCIRHPQLCCVNNMTFE